MNPKTVHGFYYTQKEEGLFGLELPPVCRDIFAHASRTGFRKHSARAGVPRMEG